MKPLCSIPCTLRLAAPLLSLLAAGCAAPPQSLGADRAVVALIAANAASGAAAPA